MKYDLFFELAKKAGIEACEIHAFANTRFECSLFHSEMDHCETSRVRGIKAKGIFNHKMGTAFVISWSKENAQFLVDQIVESATLIENDDPVFIFKGSEKYHKVKIYNKELKTIPLENKIKDLYSLEEKIQQIDPRITEVAGVSFRESESSSEIYNSYGLKLKTKHNSFAVSGEVIAKQGEQTKSGFDIFSDNDYSKLNIDELAKDIVKSAVEKLGASSVPSMTCPVLLKREMVDLFMGKFIDYADSYLIQKNTSPFIGKLHTKVASSNISIEDRPINKTFCATAFDDENVATYNKVIIKKGVLETYLYNLTTAKKDNVETTGNASGSGSVLGCSPFFLHMKPGKKSIEETIKDIKQGFYLTDVEGVHAGFNATSGDFSLKANGFLIEDGKITRPVDDITISGNLLKLFNSVKTVCNDYKVLLGSSGVPSILIKKLKITGK